VLKRQPDLFLTCALTPPSNGGSSQSHFVPYVEEETDV